jgi:hypothetical protein
MQNDKPNFSLTNISVTESEEKMMAALGEPIIPTKNFIGAEGVTSLMYMSYTDMHQR